MEPFFVYVKGNVQAHVYLCVHVWAIMRIMEQYVHIWMFMCTYIYMCVYMCPTFTKEYSAMYPPLRCVINRCFEPEERVGHI